MLAGASDAMDAAAIDAYVHGFVLTEHRQFDAAAALVKSLEASRAANRATLANARLNLSFTRVTAPISGTTTFGYDVTGELSLHGQRRTLTLQARQKGDRLVAEVTLHQPDFGIKPYTAMLGTLRIRPDVKLQLSLPWQPATT